MYLIIINIPSRFDNIEEELSITVEPDQYHTLLEKLRNRGYGIFATRRIHLHCDNTEHTTAHIDDIVRQNKLPENRNTF